MSDLSISLCMIVKNEERNLERCLASVQGIVDEIVLVDTGSNDRSVEIASAFGAKVLHHTWQDNFSLARNIGLEQACGGWILILDADEELQPETRPRIRPLLSETDADAISLRVRNFNPFGEYTEYQDSWQVRLFRNRPEYRYEQSVHNQITSSILRAGGKIFRDDTLIWLHYGYMERAVQGVDDRYQRSLKMLEQALTLSPQNAYLNAKLGILYYHLGDYSLAYTYLHRLFTELDAKELDIESLNSAMIALAVIAIKQQHFDLAIRSAQSCVDLTSEDTNTLLYALGLLARANAEQGKHHLQLIEQGIAIPNNVTQSVESFRLDHLQQGLQALKQASQHFERLQLLPGLSASMQTSVAADLGLCQEMIAAAEKMRPGPKLQTRVNSNTPTLSLCMIVRNEERNLERCLLSVKGVVDEIVLVDTGSIDRTVEIAADNGAKVYQHTWQNDFALARNISLDKATSKWILVIDADEELEDASRTQVKPLLAVAKVEAIECRVRNFMPPNSLTEYNDVMQIRLFRNRPAYRYHQTVHNQIEQTIRCSGGKIDRSELTIRHYGYVQQMVQGNDTRDQRNLKMLEQAVALSPQNAYLNAKLGVTYYNLGKHAQAYAYLRRVFGELDSRELGTDTSKEALLALAAVAIHHRHFDLAIRCAQAGVDIAGEDTAALLLAMDYLSQAYAYIGEEHFKEAEQAVQQPVIIDHLHQGRTALQQAQIYLTNLYQHPNLNPSSKPEIEANLNTCQRLLSVTDDRITELSL